MLSPLGPAWLAEVALAATSGTTAEVCALGFVEALVREGAARAAYVFGGRTEVETMSLLASTRSAAMDGPRQLPLGGPAVVGPDDPAFEALSLYSLQADCVFFRCPVGPMSCLLAVLDALPSDAEAAALTRVCGALGNMLVCALHHERSLPPAAVPPEPTPMPFDDGQRSSGIWLAAEHVARERRRTEHFLESVVENIPDMVFVKDAAELRFVRFNRAGERLLGWPRETLMGKNDHDFFPPSEADFFIAKDREVLSSRALLEIQEEPIHTANGTRYLHTKKIPICDEAGTPIFLLGISEDITEKKLGREALKERELRFQNLFRGAPVSLWELDASRARDELEVLRQVTSSVTLRVRRIFDSIHTLSVNDATLRLFGAPDLDSIRNRLPQLLGVDHHGGSLVDALLELGSGAGVVEREITGCRLDGGPLHLLMRVTVPPDAGPDLSYILLSLTDVSALKAAESALTRAAEELRRSNGELQQFAYVASHDLQEPLRVIIAFSDLLKKELGEGLTSDARDYMEFVVDAATRMQRLIRDLLAYARVDTRAGRMERQSLSLPLADALANLRIALDEADAEIVVSPDPLPEAFFDVGQLAQVLQNLLGNALKFRGDAPPRVTLSAATVGDVVEVTVTDNGIGFDSQYRERIFEVFQRLHGPGKYPGTGIGLALCRKIVERHGGHISAVGEPGKGATFQFTLANERRQT